MARRKQARSRRRSSRRRRLGALGKIGAGVLYKVAGAVAGKVLTNVLDKQLPESGYKKWLVSATPIAGGFLTSMISKAPMAKDLAEGMFVIGGVQLLQQSGALGALNYGGSMEAYNRNFVALGPSFQNQRGVVAGLSELDLSKASIFES